MRTIPSTFALILYVLICAWVGPGVVCGQNKIPYEAVTSTVSLSPEHLRVIDAYVAQRIQQLLGGDASKIQQAREELLDPMGLVGASPRFLMTYSGAVSGRLSPGVRAEKPLMIRLNTMIVASALRDPGVVRVIDVGLDDQNPAVRYWAAKAAGRVATKGTIPKNDQLILLNKLTAMLSKEHTPEVSDQALRGLVGLTIQEASVRLLEEINQAADQVAVDPSKPVVVLADVLRNFFVNTVQASTTGQKVSDAQLRQMLQVAYRLMNLSATLLDLNQVEPRLKQGHVDLLQLTDAVLIWAAGQTLPGGRSKPDSIKRQIELGNWPAVRFRAEEWKLVLVSEPLNFTERDLAVSFDPKH